MKNLHLIPTNKPSRLCKTDKLRLYPNGLTPKSQGLCKNQNICITNDEVIKERDWYIADNKVYRASVDHMPELYTYPCKKIILTTDEDLIKDCVQPINNEFLEWFVKNPSCEEVKVENMACSGYKIIIPKEEPLTKLQIAKNIDDIGIGKEEPKQKYICYKCQNKTSNKFEICDKCNVGWKESKQETLEVKRNYEKHSLTKTKGYKLWCNIIQRCYNPNNHSYKYYGEKGVIMEDYFKNSYENFINWIKGIANYEKWLNSSELSLDRIDNTLGYVRGNIKFSTKTEQVENQNLRLDNKSGYKGVCYHKLNKKYGATITINKSKVFLGYYDTALEAALVYDNYVLKNNLNRKTNL